MPTVDEISQRRRVRHVLAIVVLGFLVYSNTFHVPFVLDDGPQIAANAVIRNLGNFFSSPTGYQYNPRRVIGYLTFAVNYSLGGLDTSGYHIFNLIVHVANGLLLYALVLLTFRTPRLKDSVLAPSSGTIALVCAVLFEVHPLQTEAVTYIVQRVTSLAAMFYLGSLVLYVKMRFLQESSHSSRARVLSFYALSLVAIVLAMKTKEITFTLPFVILLYEFFFFGPGNTGKRLLFLAPVLLTAVIVPVSLLNLHRPLGDILSEVDQATLIAAPKLSRWDYLLTQFSVVATYVRLLFLPFNQNLDYDYPVYHSFFNPAVFMPFFFLSLLFVTAIVLFWKSLRGSDGSLRLISFGILWFFITLSVESSLIPIDDVIAEHRMYVPSIGALIAITAAAGIFVKGVTSKSARKMITALVCLLVIAFSIVTIGRNAVWGDKVSLWADAVKKSPRKARPHNNLGSALIDDNRIKEGIACFREAVRLRPDYFIAYNNLGIAFEKEGLTAKAIEEYRRAVALDPSFPNAHNNLAVLYGKMGLLDKAIEHLRIVVRLQPEYAEAHNNLGISYEKKGLPDDAIAEYRTAVKLNPLFADALNNLGSAYGKKGLLDDAIAEYRKAVSANPSYAEAHNNLGVAYATKGLMNLALEQFNTAVRLDPRNQVYRSNLDRAYGKL